VSADERVRITWEPPPPTYLLFEDGFQQTSTDGGKTWNPPLPPRAQPTEELFGDPEWDLIGLVCDQIDRANPDLPIEVCQAIAKDIIKLVRSHDG
jgi:hypothetical protein